MAQSPARAALVVDVVASRSHPDRAALHERLVEAFARTAADFPAERAPGVTVGDEFQATYATLGAAIGVAFAVRLELAPQVEIRAGFGYGAATALADEAGAADGPAWWAARDAIVEVEERAGRAATKHARFAYRTADETAPPPAAVDPALACLDQLLGPLDERSWRVLRGLVDDVPQQELAQQLRISTSAVSQRVRGHGLAVAAQAIRDLRSLP